MKAAKCFNQFFRFIGVPAFGAALQMLLSSGQFSGGYESMELM